MVYTCECGWRIITSIPVSLNCPSCATRLMIKVDENNQPPVEINTVKQINTPILDTSSSVAHWKSLHSFPLINRDKWDKKEAQIFYNNWEQTIPNISCGCRKNWFELKKTISLDKMFDSPESFFRWSVEAHNAVNKKLNKTIVSYEEACQIHGF